MRTNEEKRAHVIAVFEDCLKGDNTSRVITALEDAIALLRQDDEKNEEKGQWIQPCNAAISRQAVLEIVERELNKGDALFEIEQLPPVTPQSKMGDWIKHDTGHSIYYDCSLCGCVAPATETADSVLWKLSNFCPDCGASMQNKGTKRVTYTDDVDAGGKRCTKYAEESTAQLQVAKLLACRLAGG